MNQGQCRCGHGRVAHRRASGRKCLPCQALVRELKPGWTSPDGSIAVGDRMVTAACKCRDYVLPGGKSSWGAR